MAFTEKAKKAITENGGSIEGDYANWPDGTELIESSDRGGWGNFSYREWMLPNGQCVCWDNESQEHQMAYRRNPETKAVIRSR